MRTAVVHTPTVSLARLYVIKQQGRELYWTCSAEHATGWFSHPKQSFSPSELTKEIRRLIDEGWFTDCEILELAIRPPAVGYPGEDK